MKTHHKNKTWMLLAGIVYATSSISQSADNIIVSDTRNISSIPANYSRNVRFEMKARTAVSVPGSGDYSGMMTIAPWGDNSGNKNHQLNFNDGGIYYRQGLPQGSWEGWRKLITGDANGNVGIGTYNPAAPLHVLNTVGRTNTIIEGSDPYIYSGLLFVDNGQTTAGKVKQWAILAGRDGGTWGSGLGFFRYDAVNPCSGGICDFNLFLHDNGNVGIGTMNPPEKLTVNGNVRTRKVIVTQQGWGDYVFDSAYAPKSLEEISAFIRSNKHLPDMPSAKEIEAQGLDLGEIIKQQQVKIEELTLYIIEENKAKKEQRTLIDRQQKQLDEQALLLKQLQVQLQQLRTGSK